VPSPRPAPRVPDALTDVSIGDVVHEPHWDRLRVTGAVDAGVIDELDASECRLVAVVAHGLEIRDLRFADVVIDGCDLSGSLVRGAALRRVLFRDCRLSGIVFDGSTLHDVTFEACKLDTANLRSIDAERLVVTRSMLREADFTSARLRDSRLEDDDLMGARFTKVSARGLRLCGSDVTGILGADALRGSVIDDAQVGPFALALFDALGVRVHHDDTDQADLPRSS
jgi:hypothetical protein